MAWQECDEVAHPKWLEVNHLYGVLLPIMKGHVSGHRRRQHPYEDVCLTRARLSNLGIVVSIFVTLSLCLHPNFALSCLLLFNTYLKYLPCSSYNNKRFTLSTSFQISVQKHSNFAISYPVSLLPVNLLRGVFQNA